MEIRITSRHGRVWVIALAVLAIAGCTTYRQVASRYPRSDIEAIYDNALPNPKRNPVVLIHGFGGATLQRSQDGATVWGAFFTKDSLAPSKPEGLRAFALDIDDLKQPVDQARLVAIEDDAEAVELLERVEADAVVADVNVKIYAALVRLMERGGYRSCRGTYDASEEDRPACFTFFYDWRQDNVGNAIALARFLKTARRQVAEESRRGGIEIEQPVRFDVVAHSMGGLIARYFLRYGGRDVLAEEPAEITWAGAEFIDRLILISTPSFGSMKVLREMITGRRFPLVKFEPAMIATWVSPYQMLPREHHRLWLDEEGGATAVELLSTQVWERNGWGAFAPGQDEFLQWVLPGEPSPERRRERLRGFMDAAFERARRFNAAIDRHADQRCPAEVIFFASDVQPTLARAIVAEKHGRTILRFESNKQAALRAPGDGSVTRASALADERLAGGTPGWVTSPIPWTRGVFLTDTHRTLLGNPTFQNNLLHILLETPPPSG